MKFRRCVAVEVLLCLLALGFLVLSIVCAFYNFTLFLIAFGSTVFVVLLFVVRIDQIRRGLAGLITNIGPGISAAQQSLLGSVQVPIVVTDSGNNALWYNDAFRVHMNLQYDIYLEDVSAVIPEYDAQACLTGAGGSYMMGDHHYTMYSTGSLHGNDTLYVSFLFDDSTIYHEAENYRQTRPSVLMISVDSIEDHSAGVRESERTEQLSEVYRVLETFINSTNGILLRQSSQSYVAIVEEKHIAKIIEKRFPILDTVRGIPTGTMPVSLSIGVGRGSKTLYENYVQARQALDMALGRGGDQAAMKTRNGYEFYGGVSRAVEKRNKVKSRMVANALVELMQTSGSVLVMGHKSSDLDALGAAIGISRIAQIAQAECNIVFNAKTTMAKPLLDKLILEGYGELFLSPAEAIDAASERTLLVIVDCHTSHLVESEELLKKVKNIVLVDHHRRMVGYIEDAVLSYHEPYASSCCELIAELLQNLESNDNKPTEIEAESMLAGMMLDTKNFSIRTGVRTFEAASYLRRLGADPTQTRLLFATDLATYRHKAALVSVAQVYRGCAVVVTDQLPEDMRVVIPQAADDLLNIDGINASIVAVKFQNRIHISSRSLGTYNVQLIMEYLGGGGHQTMAGVQIDNADLAQVRTLIHEAVNHYLEDNVAIMQKER